MLTRNASAAAIVPTALALFSLTVSGCGDDVQGPAQPPGWDDGIRVAEAYDFNPDPKIVEVNLHAALANLSFAPGQTTTVWTYNGQIPGPLIRARVGDRVIVHLTNDLPEPTTIHWHGLRIPAAMDGMPTPSQPPIPPGGGFDYDFVVPDASTFWYHPHVDSAAQVGYGLYGPLIVDDPHEPRGLGDEVVMVVSDIAIGDDGTLAPANAGGDLASYFGREGNVMLVNGQVRPTLKARPGAAAALAHHQRRQEPLLPDLHAGPFLSADRRGRRPADGAHRRRHAGHRPW